MKKLDLYVLVALLAALSVVAEAKKKPEAAQQPQGPRPNIIDLRPATFVCDANACVLDVTRMNLIACSPQGCAMMTHVAVTPGPVNRLQPQPPTPQLPPAAPAK